MQRHNLNSDRAPQGKSAGRVSAVLAMTGLLLLSACGGGGGDFVTENNLPEPGKDGVPPVLESVKIQPKGNVEVGDKVRVTFEASEAIMTPIVTINGVEAEATPITFFEWGAVHEITEADPLGFITFTITYQDSSGEVGEDVSETTDGSWSCFGEEGVVCPLSDDLGPLEGHWRLDFAGSGLSRTSARSSPRPISASWPPASRECPRPSW